VALWVIILRQLHVEHLQFYSSSSSSSSAAVLGLYKLPPSHLTTQPLIWSNSGCTFAATLVDLCPACNPPPLGTPVRCRKPTFAQQFCSPCRTHQHQQHPPDAPVQLQHPPLSVLPAIPLARRVPPPSPNHPPITTTTTTALPPANPTPDNTRSSLPTLQHAPPPLFPSPPTHTPFSAAPPFPPAAQPQQQPPPPPAAVPPPSCPLAGAAACAPCCTPSARPPGTRRARPCTPGSAALQARPLLPRPLLLLPSAAWAGGI
jgi:hypothetical protein